MAKILVIDDEQAILSALTFALEDDYQVFTADNPADGIGLLGSQEIDLVLLDQRLGTVNGLDVLRNIKAMCPEVPVITMTAYGTIDDSVTAMKLGAYYYLTKPLDLEELKIMLKKALEYQNMRRQVERLSQAVKERYTLENVIGHSRAMQQICQLVERVRDVNINVLLTGESGTGKEVIARAIHYTGVRREQPMESINCAAIPYQLLESELFGYEKGAFTGAVSRKRGKLEQANGGTVFLDEIGEMDISLQAKLLRVIQEKQVTPLGQEKPVPLDIRIIAATNKNLRHEIDEGRFRSDLFFRLNVVSIELPPLRERREDIPELITHFIAKYNKQFEKQIKGITPGVADILEGYHYPGNIRELENIIERAIALCPGEEITLSDLPPELAIQADSLRPMKSDYIPVKIGSPLHKAEELLICSTLEHFDGNRRRTAEALGISERGLRLKLKLYQEEGGQKR